MALREASADHVHLPGLRRRFDSIRCPVALMFRLLAGYSFQQLWAALRLPVSAVNIVEFSLLYPANNTLSFPPNLRLSGVLL